MQVTFSSVNEAFTRLVKLFNGSVTHSADVVRRPSRNGDVLMIDEPVVITYLNPRHRVLFNAARDCNVAMHLYESLYHLAGRNDVGPLAYYSSKIAQYSDDGKTFNGAYGRRWRWGGHSPWGGRDNLDQLNILVNHLKADPNSRRAVLQMWEVESDLLKIGPGEGTSRDVCCNLSVLFSLRAVDTPVQTRHPDEYGEFTRKYHLDITVFNRSNDLIWGALGVNCVVFSMLQEYMASRLGVAIGRYHQVTNNLHVYTWNWKPDEWLAADQVDYGGDIRPGPALGSGPVTVRPPEGWTLDDEIDRFVDAHQVGNYGEKVSEWYDPFLRYVANPLLRAFHHYKHDQLDLALKLCHGIQAGDWRLAMTQWVQRRIERRTAK